MTRAQQTLWGLLAFAAVAAALGTYAYVEVIKGDEKREAAKDQRDRLFAPQAVNERGDDGGAAEATFTKLVIKAHGEETVLERRSDGVWNMVSPIKARAAPTPVQEMLSVLQTFKLKGVVDPDPDAAALTRYGLSPPAITVDAFARVGSSAQERTVHFEVGAENSYDGTVYIRRDSAQAVDATEAGARWAFEKTPAQLREVRLLPVEPHAIESVSVKGSAHSYRLSREGKRSWLFTQPAVFAADTAAIEGMLGNLGAAAAWAFFDAPADAGLEGFAVVASLELVDGGTVTWRAQPFTTDGGLAARVVVHSAEGTTWAHATREALALDRVPEELRDRAVVMFDRDAVHRVSFRPKLKAPFTVERLTTDAGEEAWKVVGTDAAVKPYKVSTALWLLRSLRATAFGDVNPSDWGEYGLGDDAATVELRGKDESVLATFRQGRAVPGSKAAHVYVRGTRNQVLQADGAKLADLPQSLTDLLESFDGGN